MVEVVRFEKYPAVTLDGYDKCIAVVLDKPVEELRFSELVEVVSDVFKDLGIELSPKLFALALRVYRTVPCFGVLMMRRAKEIFVCNDGLELQDEKQVVGLLIQSLAFDIMEKYDKTGVENSHGKPNFLHYEAAIAELTGTSEMLLKDYHRARMRAISEDPEAYEEAKRVVKALMS